MSSTELVTTIMKGGLVPADRPQDRVQRIFTGLFFGTLVGSLITILFFSDRVSLVGYAVPFIVLFVIGAIGYAVWAAVRGKNSDQSIPVVAKVLGTSEAESERRTRTGDIICPVVVRPLEGADFRSIIVSSSGSKQPAKDLAPGTIMALRQVEPGIGDLVVAPATDEQRDLMERWAKNPKLVSNRPPILAGRRGPLERQPLSAAIEFYLSLSIGAGVMFGVLQFV
ncbi:hypothetical protein [Flaviflexus huanghaiensis]|uniref:hypothetical protein n=1 Tax=Flaviflexus huanghaiensis TaxID=1111473 RepID=UPI0015FBD961|nr:hypothetical protein [Flaviflexus huanghaiensis]